MGKYNGAFFSYVVLTYTGTLLHLCTTLKTAKIKNCIEHIPNELRNLLDQALVTVSMTIVNYTIYI